MLYAVCSKRYSVIVVSLVVMVGWFLGIDAFTRIVPGFVTMKFTTALSFFLAGLLLLFTTMREHDDNEWSAIVLPSASFAIFLLMGTTLLSVVFEFRSGIEKLFVEEEVGALLTTVPGRPSVGTMVAFIALAILGIYGMQDWSLRIHMYRILGIVVACIGAVALLGYIISNPVLFYVVEGVSTAMALHTAALFAALGLGYIALSRKTRTKT